MSSCYFDVMLSNAKVATVSIRQLQIEHWVYEITLPGEPTQRGTVEWLDPGTDQGFGTGAAMLSLVTAVLNDYALTRSH